MTDWSKEIFEWLLDFLFAGAILIVVKTYDTVRCSKGFYHGVKFS